MVSESLIDFNGGLNAESTLLLLVTSFLLVGQSDSDEAEAFLTKYWPGASIVCDPTKHFYDAVGLRHGSVWQILGPRVWACAMRAGVKGNFQTRIIGDPWTLPAFLQSFELGKQGKGMASFTATIMGAGQRAWVAAV